MMDNKQNPMTYMYSLKALVLCSILKALVPVSAGISPEVKKKRPGTEKRRAALITLNVVHPLHDHGKIFLLLCVF